MGKRQRVWARRRRDELMILLGGKCVTCGTTKSLEFDVVIPLSDNHHKIEWSWRISYYWKQYYAGNLKLRCGFCNRSKSISMELIAELQPDQPF